MKQNLQILFFFSTLLACVNCGCSIGYFTKESPCDTKATLIKSSQYASADIGVKQWHYFYLPLSDLGDSFGLNFQVDGLPVDAYINFQQPDQYKLPTESYYDYGFYANDGDQTISLSVLTSGMKNRNSGKMLLGIYNRHFMSQNVKIRYYTTEEDEKSTLNFVIGIVIAVLAGIFVVLGLVVIILHIRRRREEIRRRQNARFEPEAQGILISPISGDHAKSADAFTLEEFQKYFPKKSFKDLKNQFQQTGCSVCLEDFAAETECYQFYCNHIFHEACVQIWLEKKNSCPSCRLPLGKKAIEEFLETQKKQNEVNVPEAIEIKVQDQEVVNEQENNNQTQTSS